MRLELKSGEVLYGRMLAKAFNVLVFKCDDGSHKLVSKMALKNPKDFNFKFDESEQEEYDKQ